MRGVVSLFILSFFCFSSSNASAQLLTAPVPDAMPSASETSFLDDFVEQPKDIEVAPPPRVYTPPQPKGRLLTATNSQKRRPAFVSPRKITAVSSPPAAATTVPAAVDQSAPVDFEAGQALYDDTGRIVSARDNVIIKQSGRVLTADEVVYNLNTDRAIATGNVVLTDVNGDVHRASRVDLRDSLQDGDVEDLKSVLQDGSRLSAEEGERFDGVKTKMYDATYTACEPCERNPDADPIWQIKADTVTHHKDERRISYEGAKFEVAGIPLAYVPYFSHPDGTVEKKSGFLAPSGGFKSDLGAFADITYYWDIGPGRDATLGLITFSQENPLLYGEWRERWNNAELNLQGGITYAERVDSEGGVDLKQDEEIRGHILANALWDIDNQWRAGADIQYASDDQYMRTYDFVDDDVLVSDIYAERFSGRNYLSGRLISFQDVRVRELQEDQPEILPEIVASYEGRPNGVPLVGGNWFLDSSYLGLRRGGSGQDYDRIALGGGWRKRLVSQNGLLTTMQLSARQDIYNVRDREGANDPLSTIESEKTDNRFFPQAHLVTSYPMVRYGETTRTTFEPILSVTAAPNINVSGKIPNEDSQDVQLDSNTLFNPDRFPGLDRIEDQSRLTYGVRTGVYSNTGAELRGFLGQSYRFEDDDNPFPNESGLSTRSSDVVGEVAALYNDDYSLNYRFQLDSRNLSSRRHEIFSDFDFGRFSIATQYLFAKALDDTDIDEESREQFAMSAGYYWTRNWRSRLSLRQDLGETPGLRRAAIGLDYFGQCMFLSLTGQRNLTDDASGESDIEILFKIGLRNLGEFEESEWDDKRL